MWKMRFVFFSLINRQIFSFDLSAFFLCFIDQLICLSSPICYIPILFQLRFFVYIQYACSCFSLLVSSNQLILVSRDVIQLGIYLDHRHCFFPRSIDLVWYLFFPHLNNCLINISICNSLDIQSTSFFSYPFPQSIVCVCLMIYIFSLLSDLFAYHVCFSIFFICSCLNFLFSQLIHFACYFGF